MFMHAASEYFDTPVPDSSSELDREDFGVRFRVYPTRLQQQVLKRWIGTQRYIYNRKVEELDYQLRLKAISKFSNRFEAPEVEYARWDQSFAKYKHSAPWMTQIPSVVRRNSCSRFKAAMWKWGSGTGRKPQNKTRHSKQSVLLTAESFRMQTVQCNEGREVKLFLGPKSENYGVLKWIAHCDFNEPRQISITHEPDGKWFVGFSFQAKEWIPAPQLPRTLSEVMGNDRGSLTRSPIIPAGFMILLRPRKGSWSGEIKSEPISRSSSRASAKAPGAGRKPRGRSPPPTQKTGDYGPPSPIESPIIWSCKRWNVDVRRSVSKICA